MWIDALGPDRCRSDRCAPCSYWHTKKAALNGGRDRLSDEELHYVGVGVPARDTSGGWRQPDNIAVVFADQLSPEDAAMLCALMDVDDPGRERLRFLG